MQTQLAMAEERRFEYSFERTLQHDFIRYAQQHPQAVAVIDELGEMTYGELYLAALTLSTQLRLQGGMTGEAIAILADKGRLQPVAILAALMCGKAFLPMDKGWPLQRRLGVMAQASINTLLSSEPWETSQINVVGLSATGRPSRYHRRRGSCLPSMPLRTAWPISSLPLVLQARQKAWRSSIAAW